MLWKDLVVLGIIVLGIILFLYGSNYFDATVGWTGVYLMITGFFVEIVLYAYGKFKKKSG